MTKVCTTGEDRAGDNALVRQDLMACGCPEYFASWLVQCPPNLGPHRDGPRFRTFRVCPGVVHVIHCADYPYVYVGETGNFKTRLQQHKNDVKNKHVVSNVVAENCAATSHAISWEDSRVIAREKNHATRLYLESLIIQTTPHTLNRNEGNLPPIYARRHFVMSDIVQTRRWLVGDASSRRLMPSEKNRSVGLGYLKWHQVNQQRRRPAQRLAPASVRQLPKLPPRKRVDTLLVTEAERAAIEHRAEEQQQKLSSLSQLPAESRRLSEISHKRRSAGQSLRF
ncbi:hypothetical protein HPB52_021803 [Rhipicephalus sanguineus]|uniref:GIY-YIG domain-containing protein n=1 Tax=Rhipicephalus sanguineus TaxID=34632 RepID=A0A9D4QC58_RHISA|nr:hypothetical protein HPB52_021803 [Rhipicephalus sanguineus]